MIFGPRGSRKLLRAIWNEANVISLSDDFRSLLFLLQSSRVLYTGECSEVDTSFHPISSVSITKLFSILYGVLATLTLDIGRRKGGRDSSTSCFRFPVYPLSLFLPRVIRGYAESGRQMQFNRSQEREQVCDLRASSSGDRKVCAGVRGHDWPFRDFAKGERDGGVAR